VQFGHAGSCANADAETAVTKNSKLREAGAHVPSSFDDLGNTIMYIIVTLLYVTMLVNLRKFCRCELLAFSYQTAFVN